MLQGMPMNPWLERALVAWAAGAVASTVIVTTAKNPHKKKKRRKKKKKSGDGIKVSVDDAVPRSTGAQAAHDYRLGVERGMTGDELLDNVKGLGGKAKKLGSWVSAGLFGTEVPKDPPKDAQPAEPAAKEPDVVEDAKRVLREAVVEQAAEKAGVAGVVEELKEQTAKLKDVIPDDAGEKLKAAGSAVAGGAKKAGAAAADGAKKAGAAIKDTFTPEKIDAFEKKLDKGLKNIGRWFQGPGAPKDDDEPPPPEAPPPDERPN